jgi:hypothetical protein
MLKLKGMEKYLFYGIKVSLRENKANMKRA